MQRSPRRLALRQRKAVKGMKQGSFYGISYLLKTAVAFAFLLAFAIIALAGGYPEGYRASLSELDNPYLYAIFAMPFLILPSLFYLLFVHRPRSLFDALAIVFYLLALALNVYLFVYDEPGRIYFAPGANLEALSYFAAAAGPLMSIFFLLGDGLAFFARREDNERLVFEGKGKILYRAFLSLLGASVLASGLYFGLFPTLGPVFAIEVGSGCQGAIEVPLRTLTSGEEGTARLYFAHEGAADFPYRLALVSEEGTALLAEGFLEKAFLERSSTPTAGQLYFAFEVGFLLPSGSQEGELVLSFGPSYGYEAAIAYEESGSSYRFESPDAYHDRYFYEVPWGYLPPVLRY